MNLMFVSAASSLSGEAADCIFSQFSQGNRRHAPPYALVIWLVHCLCHSLFESVGLQQGQHHIDAVRKQCRSRDRSPENWPEERQGSEGLTRSMCAAPRFAFCTARKKWIFAGLVTDLLNIRCFLLAAPYFGQFAQEFSCICEAGYIRSNPTSIAIVQILTLWGSGSQQKPMNGQANWPNRPFPKANTGNSYPDLAYGIEVAIL
jgi:hypothetical protein